MPSLMRIYKMNKKHIRIKFLILFLYYYFIKKIKDFFNNETTFSNPQLNTNYIINKKIEIYII